MVLRSKAGLGQGTRLRLLSQSSKKVKLNFHWLELEEENGGMGVEVGSEPDTDEHEEKTVSCHQVLGSFHGASYNRYDVFIDLESGGHRVDL